MTELDARAAPPGGILRAWRTVRAWPVWALPLPLRCYIVAAPLFSAAALVVTAAMTHWHSRLALIFVALLVCGAVAIEATRAVKEPQGTTVRDLQSVWYLAIAVTLPPVYAFAAPVLLVAYRLWRGRRLTVYRRVFSNATISLAYGCASVVFHMVPATVAGAAPGSGRHVLTWTAVAAGCAALGWLINSSLLLGAIKLADPEARFRELFGSREAVLADAIEICLAVSAALIIALSPVLMVLALPTVIVQRLYIMHMQLAAQARVDAKTGVLNAVTWQREAAAELTRAARTGSPLALALVDIDQFKSVNESAGHLIGDQLLRDVAGMLTDQLRDGDLIGRIGDEEFAILLPQTSAGEARRLAERLRDHVAGEPIAIELAGQAGFVFRLTVSIGVAILADSRRALGELIGVADSALGHARSTGWNRVWVIDVTELADRGPAERAAEPMTPLEHAR